MARTIQDIKNSITQEYISNPTIIARYGLDVTKNFEEQFSVVSLESILFYTVAVVIWTLEKLFDHHTQEINDAIARLKPHTLRWYRDKALRFQLGRELIPDSDIYDNTGLTPEDITALEVVVQAAAVEQENHVGRRILRIKIAGNSHKLEPLPESTVMAVESYFAQIKDAGVLLQVTSGEPDKLFGDITIHYNPTVLDGNGRPLSGGDNQPVREAVTAYLQNLTFNGEFSIMRMIDAIQTVTGVELAHATAIRGVTRAGIDTTIFDRYTPDSGYMRVIDESDLNIYYAPYI